MQKVATAELKDLDVDRVDGVDRPANGRPFALFKFENPDKETIAMATEVTKEQLAEIMKGYAAVATAADMLLKALRKDATGRVNKSTAIATNGLAQILGAEPVFVSKAVPTQPYEISENVDGDKRGPADENLGGNFTPRSMPGSMVGKVQFAVKGVSVKVDDAAPMVEDEEKKPAYPFGDEMKAAIKSAVAEAVAAVAPVAKAEVVKVEDKAPVVKAEEKPASKQVDKDEAAPVAVEKSGKTSFANIVFGAAA